MNKLVGFILMEIFVSLMIVCFMIMFLIFVIYCW